MADCVTALKDWTGKEFATIFYDSTVDEFTGDGIFNRVKGKKNIALVGFTTDGDVFGGFYSVAVTDQGFFFSDPNMFVFSFESHGRCMTPQRFVVKEDEKDDAFVYFCMNYIHGMVLFGVNSAGSFFLGNERSNSFCWDMSYAFEGLDDTTLSGKNSTFDEGPYHHCTRLVAIHLK